MKMKSRFYIAAAACLLLGAGWGCEEKCSDDYYDYTPDPPRSYFFFPEGSWWAYENSVTGEIDTLFAGPGSGEVYFSSAGAGAPECKTGFRERQSFAFLKDAVWTNGFFVNCQTQYISNVSISIDMSQYYNICIPVEYSISNNKFEGEKDPGIYNDVLVKLDSVYVSALETHLSSVKMTNREMPTISTWFTSGVGMTKLQREDTTLILSDFNIL